MANLSQFMREFTSGFQPANYFECRIVPNAKMVNDIATLSGNIGVDQATDWLERGLVVKTASLPGRSFDKADLKIYGITEKVPTHTTYSDLECVFLQPVVKHDNVVPRIFDLWQSYIHDLSGDSMSSGADFRFPSDYYAQMFISVFDRQRFRTAEYLFDRVYPIAVESVPVSWDSQNEYLELSVTFAYSYWQLLPVEQTSSIIKIR